MMNTPEILTDKNTTYGAQFIGSHSFVNGPKVPLYDITTMNALNQIIGHAKFGNRQYGNVYYRGVTDLYNNALPCFFRTRISGAALPLRKTINIIYDDAYFQNSLKVKPVHYSRKRNNNVEINAINRNSKYVIEGLLQHYSGNTRFLDVVDNHWVALWMGLHTCQHLGRGKQYCRFEKRMIPIHDYVTGATSAFPSDGSSITSLGEQLYLYVLLIAMPNVEESVIPGIKESETLIEVDLRKALPSTYVRPHAQHALVVGKREGKLAKDNDMASQVVGILRVRLDYASQWLGSGSLLTQDNLFPSPAVDQGYDNLLHRKDIFTSPFEVINYF